MSNPFSIVFGIEPINFIERLNEKELIIQNFSQNPSPCMTYILTGLRGSGKTVMLTYLYNYFDSKNEWIVIDPINKKNLLENIVSELYTKAKLKTKFINNEFSFSFQGISISFKGNEEIVSTISLFKKMLDILKKKNKKILIVIDEVDNSSEMKSFIETYQALIRQNYPLYLLMTGLDENINKLQNNPSLTFLYRAQKIPMSFLSISSITYNYEKYLKVEKSKAQELAKITKGYPYAYQALGYLLCENNKKDIDSKILYQLDDLLANNVYFKIYSSLTTYEKKVLDQIKGNNKIKVNEIIKKMNTSSNTFTQYRIKLIKKGILISNEYGYLEFALPRFSEFLENNLL